jgi:hypothetical protein
MPPARNLFEGELKYEGANEGAPQRNIHLLKVAFKPGKRLHFQNTMKDCRRVNLRLV